MEKMEMIMSDTYKGLKEFYKDKKVFLTGHTGFKGSWLSLWLHSMGARVTGYSLNPPTDPSLYDLCGIASLVKSYVADVRDSEALKKAVLETKPEIIIHMAAQALVRDSYKNPVETYATNVMGTVHLLEAARSCPSVRAVLNVTTDKCYENREWYWGYRENEPMGGYDPYSNSKGCSELVTQSYRNSFFNVNEYKRSHNVALASARAGNVIGGGDWAADRLIPDIVRSIAGGNTVMIRSPHAVRPWQFVLEPLSGYLLLVKNLYEKGPEFAEAWNFGPHDADARPVEWIVQQMCRLWGPGAKYEIDKNPQPHEAHYLKLDCSKAKLKMGWTPRWDLETAIEKIVEWTKAYMAKGNMKDITLAQIHEYSEKLI